MEIYESDSIVAALPAEYRLLATLAGVPVAETSALRYDEMAPSRDGRGLLVGEARHFLYRMRQIDLNRKCRDDAVAAIETSAQRILGEPWKVSSD